jgi:hypothetical protein
MGKKWLAVAALALIAILIVMWREINTSQATPAPTVAAKADVVTYGPTPVVEVAAPAPTAEAKTAPENMIPPMEPPKPAPATGKYDPQSDEFFYKHDEIVVPMVMRSAVKCWEALKPEARAKFHRNQSIVIKFKQKIVNGTVSMYGAEVERSSIKDPSLEKCFYDQVLATTWKDDKLPDWEQDDEIKISPRVLKKYTRENIEYVGAEAPKAGTYLTREQIDKDFDKNYKE